MKDADMDTKSISLTTCLLTATLTLTTPCSRAETNGVTAEQAVTALENTFGVTPGERRNHTKGTCAAGEFVGTAAAAPYSRSALFSGKPVPVVARFSLAGGNPKAPDTAKSARGMALEFRLPGDNLQHITMLNTPIFGAAKPQTFVDMIIASRPDPATGKPDPEKIKAFQTSHPDNLAQATFLAKNNPPPSYANSAFFGIHTFKFINSDNKITYVRWRFVPQDGEKRLTNEQLKTSPPNFLEEALIKRTKQGPIRWDMLVSIGEPGDTEDNPTIAWPDNRKTIKFGTLTISSAMPQKGAECEKINFDPLVMSDGIEPTNDPILLFRSPAYAFSFAKRMGGI
ncbi:Catalase [Sideroxydans lithotrophicus ES-1]|uniref:Catalase-related peroxidase n=1 Tax=Sideroxydans lithotrophicus (strain ES-1) TaxID=580332 RepID=D5CNN9_SIDLE|nr:Catalase [Sideroxydans lithotrophicus ES-1]